MAEILDRDITAEFAVDAFEEIEVERRGHPRRIIIGAFENRHILDAVDADQHQRPVAERRAPGAQEIDRGARDHIPDRRSREKAEFRERADFARQLDALGDRKSTRLKSSPYCADRLPSSAGT